MKKNIQRKAFDIPAINNEQEALMIYLKLDSENEADWDKVIQMESNKLDCLYAATSVGYVSIFEYENTRYHVAPASSHIDGVRVLEFNSNLWTISPRLMT